MLSSHKVCPVCGRDFLRTAKMLNKRCSLINKDRFSWVETICNHGDDFGPTSKEYPYHLFFRISTLYDEMLFQKVELTQQNVSLEINYVLHESVITYLPKLNRDIDTVVLPERLVLATRLVELDFPFLEKSIKKMKTLANFL